VHLTLVSFQKYKQKKVFLLKNKTKKKGEMKQILLQRNSLIQEGSGIHSTERIFRVVA